MIESMTLTERMALLDETNKRTLDETREIVATYLVDLENEAQGGDPKLSLTVSAITHLRNYLRQIANVHRDYAQEIDDALSKLPPQPKPS